jgi:hypothetical protein
MNLILKFKNINSVQGVPVLDIAVNNQIVWSGDVQPEIQILHTDSDNISLSVNHVGKDPSVHCVVENGQIVADRNCELDQVIVDGYDIEELKWLSNYTTIDNEVIDKCLFFGKNGTWNIKFELPILRWILKTRHNLLNNDPNWQQDYESYIAACKLLNKLN